MEETKYLISIAVAVITASITFILDRIKNRLDHRKKRKSIAITIYTEVLIIKESVENMIFEKEEFIKNLVEDLNRPILVISSDMDILNRIKLEDFNLPNEVLSSLIRSKNSIRELYQVLHSINSDEFHSTGKIIKLGLIEMLVFQKAKVIRDCDVVLKHLKAELPNKWFKEFETGTSPNI